MVEVTASTYAVLNVYWYAVTWTQKIGVAGSYEIRYRHKNLYSIKIKKMVMCATISACKV